MDPISRETKEDIQHVEEIPGVDLEGALHHKHGGANTQVDNAAAILDSDHKRRGANTQVDDAARILDSAGGQFDITPEDRKRILRKVDLFVCVPMCIIYTIQQ